DRLIIDVGQGNPLPAGNVGLPNGLLFDATDCSLTVQVAGGDLPAPTAVSGLDLISKDSTVVIPQALGIRSLTLKDGGKIKLSGTAVVDIQSLSIDTTSTSTLDVGSGLLRITDSFSLHGDSAVTKIGSGTLTIIGTPEFDSAPLGHPTFIAGAG